MQPVSENVLTLDADEAAAHRADLNAVDGHTDRLVPYADRKISDAQIEAAVPDWLRENHTAVVAEQYGGDWEAFAKTAEANARATGQHGDAAVAAWARRQAAAGVEAKTTAVNAGVASGVPGTLPRHLVDDSVPDSHLVAPRDEAEATDEPGAADEPGAPEADPSTVPPKGRTATRPGRSATA